MALDVQQLLEPGTMDQPIGWCRSVGWGEAQTHMASLTMIAPGEEPVGHVYEIGGRWYWHCRWCAYSCSSGDEFRTEELADRHWDLCKLKPQHL